jgi:hypothetical protein
VPGRQRTEVVVARQSVGVARNSPCTWRRTASVFYGWPANGYSCLRLFGGPLEFFVAARWEVDPSGEFESDYIDVLSDVAVGRAR